MGIVRFRVTGVRSSLLGGIVQVAGYKGYWLLRRPVHYQVGVNCEEILTQGPWLLVKQGAKTIAIAKYRPGLPQGEASGTMRWESMLQPRNRHGR